MSDTERALESAWIAFNRSPVQDSLAFKLACLHAIKELKTANDNLFRIKQKTVVENAALKKTIAKLT